MDLKIDADTVREVVQKAILDKITPEQRDAMLTAALQHLVSPTFNQYSRRSESPLQVAFEAAVGEAARKFATEIVNSDPAILDKIKHHIGEGFAKFDEANYSTYLGTAIGEALKQ